MIVRHIHASLSQKAFELVNDTDASPAQRRLRVDGDAVRYLATFGSEWTYVETLTEPPMRGFVPSESIVISE